LFGRIVVARRKIGFSSRYFGRAGTRVDLAAARPFAEVQSAGRHDRPSDILSPPPIEIVASRGLWMSGKSICHDAGGSGPGPAVRASLPIRYR
jgi:hypothetical protein